MTHTQPFCGVRTWAWGVCAGRPMSRGTYDASGASSQWWVRRNVQPRTMYLLHVLVVGRVCPCILAGNCPDRWKGALVLDRRSSSTRTVWSAKYASWAAKAHTDDSDIQGSAKGAIEILQDAAANNAPPPPETQSIGTGDTRGHSSQTCGFDAAALRGQGSDAKRTYVCPRCSRRSGRGRTNTSRTPPRTRKESCKTRKFCRHGSSRSPLHRADARWVGIKPKRIEVCPW